MDHLLDITLALVSIMGTAHWQVSNAPWLAACLLNLQLVGSGLTPAPISSEMTDGLGSVLIATGSVG